MDHLIFHLGDSHGQSDLLEFRRRALREKSEVGPVDLNKNLSPISELNPTWNFHSTASSDFNRILFQNLFGATQQKSGVGFGGGDPEKAII